MVRALVVVLLVSTVFVFCGYGRISSAVADEPPASAEPPTLTEDPARADASRVDAADDPNFGPVVTIERIDVVGNVITGEHLIRRALLVQPGDQLRTGDPRLRQTRLRVLALGYFVDATVSLDRGSARGQVVLTVEVWERGTFVLNRIFLGSSQATPLWAGVDVGDTNFLGTGLTVSGAVVWAQAADLYDAESQWGMRLRYGDPGVFGLPLGVSAAFLYNQASEPERIGLDAPLTGEPDDPENYLALPYTRIGGIAGVSWELTRRVSLLVDARVELVDADDVATWGYLHPTTERERIVTLALGLQADTRSDPVLPRSGSYAFVQAEAGGAATGSDYEYARVHARWQSWLTLRGPHVVSLSVGAGAVFGDAPGFDLIHVSEVDRLLPPRPLDLTVSTQRPFDFFGQSSAAPAYGTLGGVVEVEYRYRLFRRAHLVYGGDSFVAAGVFGLRGDVPEASIPTAIVHARDSAFDLSFDLGLRLDTEVGIFELSLSNALGRLPL